MNRKQLTHEMAEILRQTEPAMCDTIDRLIQAGQAPQTIQRVIDRQCPKGSLIPGMVNAYLRDRDSDFARAEDEREARSSGRRGR